VGGASEPLHRDGSLLSPTPGAFFFLRKYAFCLLFDFFWHFRGNLTKFNAMGRVYWCAGGAAHWRSLLFYDFFFVILQTAALGPWLKKAMALTPSTPRTGE
jgi:hypothetical protein